MPFHCLPEFIAQSRLLRGTKDIASSSDTEDPSSHHIITLGRRRAYCCHCCYCCHCILLFSVFYLGSLNVILTVSLWCPYGVPMLSRWCPDGVPMVSNRVAMVTLFQYRVVFLRVRHCHTCCALLHMLIAAYRLAVLPFEDDFGVGNVGHCCFVPFILIVYS